MVKRRLEVDISRVFGQLSHKLTGSRTDFFVGQEENVAFLLDLVNRTVNKGESNSILVLGPNGVGKTALVNKVIREASKAAAWLQNVVIVELNGLLQTDDRIALKEITKQLHLENVVGDKVFGSFAEHLSFLLASLKTGDKSSKPIVFILDNFDLFCSHKNQTLLYNLFDTAQSRAVPICVVGVSSQIDVTELLEKRVNSRFSHRHLNLMPMPAFTEFLQLTVQLLQVDPQENEDAAQWNKMVDAFFAKVDVKKYWEEKLFGVDKSIAQLKRVLYSVMLELAGRNESNLNLSHLESALDNSFVRCDTVQPNELLIKDLSIVEICLLIAVKHITDIYDHEPFNFEMVYHEYVKFKRRKFSTLPEERSVVFKCWENLLALELVTPRSAGDRAKGQQLEYILNSFQLPADTLQKGVEKYPHCPTEVVQWLKSSVYTGTS